MINVQTNKKYRPSEANLQYLPLISMTKTAVALATSLADWTKWRLATGLSVFDEAVRQLLQSDDVCFAIAVAADNI